MVYRQLIIGLRELIALCLGRRKLIRVRGGSMYPTYRDGDILLIRPMKEYHPLPHPGDMIVARHPFLPRRWIIKQVHAILPDGRIEIRGINAIESSDSRSYGPISPTHLVGTVTIRLWPFKQRGSIT